MNRIKIVSLLLVLFLGGCAAQFGTDGKILKYDICGWVGGVALKVGAGGIFDLELGCTDPITEQEETAVLDP